MRNTFSQKYAKNQILSDVEHAKYEMFTAFSNNVIKHLQKPDKKTKQTKQTKNLNQRTK